MSGSSTSMVEHLNVHKSRGRLPRNLDLNILIDFDGGGYFNIPVVREEVARSIDGILWNCLEE
jgi:hypothetical protein